MNNNFDLTGKYSKDTYQNLMQYDIVDGSKYDGLGNLISFNINDGLDVTNPLAWGNNIVTSVTIPNSGFENPNVLPSSIPGQPGYKYGPIVGASWNMGTGAGISTYPSEFNNPNPPEGNQVALLQGNNLSFIEQNITITTSGNYIIDFFACQRPTTNTIGQTIAIYIDNVFVYRIKPQSTSFRLYTSCEINLTSGVHNLKFVGEASGDNTAFIDRVRINPSYRWYYNFSNKVINQGKYLLSNTFFDFVSPFSLNTSIDPGILIPNIDGITQSYYINFTFNGRFLDTTAGQIGEFSIKPTIDGVYNSLINANINVYGQCCSSTGDLSPYQVNNDFSICVGGSLNFIYRSNISWYLDFLLLQTNNWSAISNPDGFRFESVSWSVTTQH